MRCIDHVRSVPNPSATPTSVFNLVVRHPSKYIVVRSEYRDEHGVVVMTGRPVIIKASELDYDACVVRASRN
jgi:hypothetical protein